MSDSPVPYGIATERLVVRCYEPSDAEDLQRVLARSREHLLPWLPWAEELPKTLDETLEDVRRFRGWYDSGTDFVMGIFAREDGALVGGTGLHPRIGPGGREIGYWLAPEYTGRGLVYETVRGLVRLGFDHLKLAKLEIRVDPQNEPSRRVPERLGFHLDGTLRQQIEGLPAEPGQAPPRVDAEVWSLLRAELAARPGDFPPITAWDAATRPIPSEPENPAN